MARSGVSKKGIPASQKAWACGKSRPGMLTITKGFGKSLPVWIMDSVYKRLASGVSPWPITTTASTWGSAARASGRLNVDFNLDGAG